MLLRYYLPHGLWIFHWWAAEERYLRGLDVSMFLMSETLRGMFLMSEALMSEALFLLSEALT